MGWRLTHIKLIFYKINLNKLNNLNNFNNVILWTAVDYKRKEESKIKAFSSDWWIQLGLLVIGSLIIGYNF